MMIRAVDPDTPIYIYCILSAVESRLHQTQLSGTPGPFNGKDKRETRHIS